MKKLLLAICLFCLTKGFAQNKEETIVWLKNNQESLLPVLTCNEINGSETATFRLELKNDSLVYAIDYNGKARWSLALKDILYQEANKMVISDAPYYDACSDLVYFIIQSAKDKITYTMLSDSGVQMQEKDSILSIVFNKNKKEDALKVLKAIMDLAKLDGAKTAQ